MLLCANENVPGDCVTELRARGHDVLWIRETAPGIADELVLETARSGGRLLITLDKDFGELVFHRGPKDQKESSSFESVRNRPLKFLTASPRLLLQGTTGKVTSA